MKLKDSLIECNNCGIRINVNLVNNYQERFICDGDDIFLTFYECPGCLLRQFVQVDDKYSIETLREAKKMFYDISKAKINGYDVSQKKSNKLKRLNEKLRKQRSELTVKYQDRIITDEKNNTFELKF